MGIPQVIVICIMAITIGINLNETSNDRQTVKDFIGSLVASLIWAALLWWGGFWK